jgi:hypothetical protein
LNGQRAIDLSQVGLVEGDDPATVLRNGLRIIEAMKSDVALTMIAAPGLRNFKLLQTRIGSLAASAVSPTSAGVAAALPSSLIKHDTIKANRVFYRYSAFNPDRLSIRRRDTSSRARTPHRHRKFPSCRQGSSPWDALRCPTLCLPPIGTKSKRPPALSSISVQSLRLSDRRAVASRPISATQ